MDIPLYLKVRLEYFAYSYVILHTLFVSEYIYAFSFVCIMTIFFFTFVWLFEYMSYIHIYLYALFYCNCVCVPLWLIACRPWLFHILCTDSGHLFRWLGLWPVNSLCSYWGTLLSLNYIHPKMDIRNFAVCSSVIQQPSLKTFDIWMLVCNICVMRVSGARSTCYGLI